MLTERRLETRDILRKTARVAVPAFFASALAFGMNLINYMLLALFQNYHSIAAYGIVSAYTTLAAGIFMPIASAAGSVLERAQGSPDPYRKQQIINTALLTAFLVGVASTVFAILIAPGYVWQVVTPEEIKEMTTLFLQLFSVNFIPIIYYGVTTNILMKTGAPQGPILAEVSALVLHVSFGYIFVGLFDMGIYGCAISAILSQWIAALVNTHLILQQRRQTPIRAPIRIHRDILKELVLEKWPAVFAAILGGIFAIFLQYYIDDLGVVTIAGFTLFFLFQEALFLPFRGFTSAARSLSSDHVDDPTTLGLNRTINPLLIVSGIYALFLIPLSRVIGPPIILFLSHHDADVTDVAMRLVNLVSWFYFFFAVSTILSAVLEGMGRDTAVMRSNIFFNFIVRFVILVLASEVIQGGESIVLCFPASWAISAGALAVYYYVNFSRGANEKYSL